MKRFYMVLVAAIAISTITASPGNWEELFNFSQEKGGSNINLSNALEVMEMETVCAYEDMSYNYGFRGDFYRRELFYDLQGDYLEENLDDTVSIMFRNGHKATADAEWPEHSELSRYLPIPNKDNAIIDYAVYDDKTLLITFSVIDKEYAKEYVSELEKLFPVVLEKDNENLFYAGKNAEGITVAFSEDKKAIILDIS